jgi:hypothetical protein
VGGLRSGDTDGDAFALEGDGGVDGIGVGADDGHELGLGRGDIDFAGGSAGGDGDVVGMAVGDCGGGGDRRGDQRNGCDDCIGGEVDHRNRAVSRLSGRSRAAWHAGIALVDDEGLGAILEDAYHLGIDSDGDRGEDGAEAGGIYGVVGIAVGVGGDGCRGAEGDADDADRAGAGSVALVGYDELVAGGREVGPERVGPDGDGVGGSGGEGVEQVGLGVDDRDGAVGLVHDEDASAVGGHDTVDGFSADGNGGGVDGRRRGVFEGVDQAGAAVVRCAEDIGAGCAGDASDKDGRVRRVDGKLLLKVEGSRLKLSDGVAAGLGDVGEGALREEAGRQDAVVIEQRALKDLAGEERGGDVEAGEGAIAVEGVAGGRGGGGGGGVEDEVVGIDADVGGDEDGVSGVVDEGDEAGVVGAVGDRGAGVGDDDGELLRLSGGAYRVDCADDRAVGVFAAGGEDQNQSGEGDAGEGSECGPEFVPRRKPRRGRGYGSGGLDCGPKQALASPRWCACCCFDSC